MGLAFVGRCLTAAAQPVLSVTPQVGGRNLNAFGSGRSGNKGEDLKGTAKEATGQATEDEELESEGKTDQTMSDLKDAKENVRDAFS